METNNLQSPPLIPFKRIVDIVIRLAVLLFLVGWCLTILRPFVLILTWAAVIAIAISPLYNFFLKIFKQKKGLAAFVLSLILVSILIIPSYLVSKSLVDEVSHLRELHKAGQLKVPPPSESTKNWPAITKPILDVWTLASENLQSAAIKYADQLKGVGATFLGAVAGIGTGILQFVVSIIIAGVFLTYSEPISKSATKIFIKLAGEQGHKFSGTIVSTVKSVVKGILGVAVIQATMAGLGYFLAGIPYAALWTVGSLFFAIIQVGAGPVAIPVMIYAFSALDTTTAVILSIWLIITLISDNILKPLLLGRSAPAPMLVVFLGAIGGFITSGFLGLFLGAVILTIGYKLFIEWVDSPQKEEPVIIEGQQ